jgi:hypothetical protein
LLQLLPPHRGITSQFGGDQLHLHLQNLRALKDSFYLIKSTLAYRILANSGSRKPWSSWWSSWTRLCLWCGFLNLDVELWPTNLKILRSWSAKQLLKSTTYLYKSLIIISSWK